MITEPENSFLEKGFLFKKVRVCLSEIKTNKKTNNCSVSQLAMYKQLNKYYGNRKETTTTLTKQET